jgi:hypothetical protein
MKASTRIAVLAALERRRGLHLELLQGGKGDPGERGPQGERGEDGRAGIQGPRGFGGEPGPQGDRGDQGNTGDKGDRGDKGEKGDKGDLGGAGPQGEKGDKGDAGERGIEWRGSYRTGTRYLERHAVHFQGSSYIARVETTRSPSDARVWDVLAKGADGQVVVLGAGGPSGSSSSGALDADLTAIAALTGTGWAKRIGADSWALSTPTAADVGADAAGTASAALASHVAAGDPHTQYALESALGSLAAQSSITASQISDAGATGVSVLQAATAATAKAALSLVKGDVGLGNLDNTSDANKPVSTAQQTALNLKADLASPALTGNPTAPTAAAGDNDTSIATTAFVSNAVPNASYRTLLDCSGSHTAAKVAGTYALGQGDPLAVSGTGTLYPLNSIFIAAADYPTVNGAAPKLRIRAELYTNDVAPTGNFTLGLYPITRPGTSGGAGVCIFTLGTVVTGSNGATFSAPAADGLLNAVSADFALPADGHYVLGVVTTATVAASSHVHISASLQLRNA